MKVTRISMLTGKVSTLELDVTLDQLARHQAGGLAQNVFPNLDDGEREFLITGITPDECFSRMFGTMQD